MIEFEFTLKFALPEGGVDPEAYIDQLAEAGCNDALIGVGQQRRIALHFNRQADSAFDAISSAIVDVKQVISEAELVEATPDLVGLTDVAEIIGCTRQNMRKLMVSGGSSFPPPLHDGKTAIWRLSKVLLWLRKNKHYTFDDKLLDISFINMQFNVAREAKDFDSALQRDIYALVS
jgi:hypothetical protein